MANCSVASVPKCFSAISPDECSRNEFMLLGTIHNNQQIIGLPTGSNSYFNQKMKELTKPKYQTIENDWVEFETLCLKLMRRIN